VNRSEEAGVKSKLLIAFVVCLFPCSLVADNTTYRVPEQFPTIQAAVAAALPGDTIRVGPGTWCGAVIAQPVNLVGEGQPGITNQGCSGPNTVIGFLLLPSARESSIRGFVFLLTSVLPAPSFGIYGKAADMVIVEDNIFQGPVFAVHNENGSGWQVDHNKISGAFEGIVFYRRCQLVTRAVDNSATFNSITEGLTDGNGIWLFGQDGAVVKNNAIEIPSSSSPPFPLAVSWGILIADDINSTKCGTSSLTSVNSIVVNNDARNAGIGVLVFLDHSGGTGNSSGNQLRGNFGVNAINVSWSDDAFAIVKDRSAWLQCDEQGNCL
jgi:hypothetical protein